MMFDGDAIAHTDDESFECMGDMLQLMFHYGACESHSVITSQSAVGSNSWMPKYRSIYIY